MLARADMERVGGSRLGLAIISSQGERYQNAMKAKRRRDDAQRTRDFFKEVKPRAERWMRGWRMGGRSRKIAVGDRLKVMREIAGP